MLTMIVVTAIELVIEDSYYNMREKVVEHLYIVVEDDGPGIPLSKREVIFDRGQRVDTLRPGQGVGLAVAREITEQYEGKIVAGESMLGGARMEVIFGRQHSAPKDE